MTKIKPILFSTPMVQAILYGSKTQTRRKNNHPYFSKEELLEHTLPSYEKSDILWVREAWRIIGWSDELAEMWIEYKDKKNIWQPAYDPDEDSGWLCKYIETMAEKGYLKTNDKTERFTVVKELPWKPSIFMPKEAARIFLEVTDVRIERLHDISTEDIIKEGVTVYAMILGEKDGPAKFLPNGCLAPGKQPSEDVIYRAFWASLWSKINGRASWEANPYVWVYEFKQTEKPENFIK